VRRRAISFIVLMGVVSLLSDITYEGARSVTGPFLASLSAPAVAVGLVAGFGELVGYGFRLFSGIIADRTGRYWTITFLGYAVNLLAVPALALTGNWPAAAGLMIAERFGKSLRAPARDALLSRATSHVGHGWGFGLHEAMDQIGAVTGPLIVAFVLHGRGDYRASFAWLLIPALLALGTLAAARVLDARDGGLTAAKPLPAAKGQQQAMWIYLTGVALVAAATADFPLIAYHFEKTSLMDRSTIPLLYATAMGMDALSALVFGRMFDRHGLVVLALPTALAAFFAPLVFSGTMAGAIAGVALWGVGMGAQESILKAAVATLAPGEKRGAAYGLFSAVYGLAWFAGSAAMGLMYGWSIPALTAFCVCGQLVAVPIFYALRREALN
jgi:MFS family permease